MTPLYRAWQAIGLDLLDWCHVAQPDDAERLAAIRTPLQAAGLALSDAEALELLQNLLDADEPPLSEPAAASPKPRHSALLCDAACREAIARAPGSIVSWLLIAGYAYHHLDQPLLSDGRWDELCREAAARWPRIDHPHKPMITPADLAAGSLYALPAESYPAIAVSAARRLLAEGPVTLPPPRRSTAPAETSRARANAVRPTRRPATSTAQQLSLF